MNKKHQRLFDKHCKHKEKYYIVAGPYDWCWTYCKDCKLRTMPYMVPHTNGEIERDVCFAIWHGREKALKSIR